MYKKHLALNNLQWLICHKTKLNQTVWIYIFAPRRREIKRHQAPLIKCLRYSLSLYIYIYIERERVSE